MWLLANKLSLNVVKTEFILIGSAQKLNSTVIQPNIEVNQVKINRVGNATVLGVEIDDRLSWDSHIGKVAKKVRTIRDLVDRETLISVYNALINPHFDCVGLSNRLQKLQNRAARVTIKFSNDISRPEALNALGW